MAQSSSLFRLICKTPGIAALLIAAQFCTAPGSAEVCRFAGTTSHDGHVAITAD